MKNFILKINRALVAKKKFTFIIAALFAASFANAQITLLHTFENWVSISTDPYGDIYEYLEAPYYYDMMSSQNTEGNLVINLYNTEDFSLYKSVLVDFEGKSSYCWLVSRNFMTTDNKICFVVQKEGNDELSYIYNEDGQLISTIKGNTPSIVKVKDRFVLISRWSNYGENRKDYTYIYSLPGNGEEQAVSTPSSPKRSAHKIAREGQVLVETETNTFDLRGQEVK